MILQLLIFKVLCQETLAQQVLDRCAGEDHLSGTRIEPPAGSRAPQLAMATLAMAVGIGYDVKMDAV